MAPEEIPIESLDQVNVAFLYIDPKDYTIINMDGIDGTKMYARLANLKTRNPKAKIWISVGGWTFNDDGAYQSIFTKMAADTSLTHRFAENLIEFMDKYGFDGVDIDWEYPGADDRGGRKEDYTNYPKMMSGLRRALQGSNRYSKKWGLSLTVPTSYWYLRWFDIKMLEMVVDEFNLMAYDLHGTWDREDPIGPYLYAHTNLTEIDDALDLFWRNDISPSKINLGLALMVCLVPKFYGRTFKLSTPLCAKPGCEWKDPGPKGPCTTTAGILSYKEIQDIIADGNLTPVYDEEAGVYYVTYGKGGANWVSFDDAISFRAKTDLANKYGLGGVLIWAIDQDDRYFNALRGVTGRDIPPVADAVDGYGAFALDQCYITNCHESCEAGDILMTRLNEDSSGRGCDGKDHYARSFCCPAVNAPESSNCYWTGGPVNCHGQCAPGEVSMVLDDYGDSKKRCTNGGKKVWCCPATNGQKSIEECALQPHRKACPADKPQEMTTVGDMYRDDWGRVEIRQKFCCPEKPQYDLSTCGWHGDNYYCNDNECPLGQIELFKYSGWHEGLDTSYHGCNKGRKQAFCCDPPLNDGSAFLPVPLENLFPDAKSFPDTYSMTFAETFDHNDDDLSSKAAGLDPNERAFTWVVMVGDVEDVQSFDKRDGSHLELYDCPNTDREDYTVQKAKAVCVGGSKDNNNCEDILLGGVEGTVVRMPSHCGPDQYVRAVRFELTNSTIPGHLRKRHPSAERVYNFHYDYNFHNLRRDGGEVYFRADFSTHVGYWYELVEASHDSPVKRSAENWRELDRRFWSETKQDWRKRFEALLVYGGQGLRKHYEWNECLFEAKAVCGIAEFDSEARVFGEMNTTMDFGTSLIGTLRNFDFQEAFSFWNQEDFSMRMGAKFHARARLYMDSGWMSVGSFSDFGMNVSAGAPGSGPRASIPLTIPSNIPLRTHEIQRLEQ
ncbi:hypothetical protein ASPCAL15012 [Aspergillus calidoustus]|uniref:chitinase n=1 Tax=Aspergillus calidoustus TaxID=454130 RepID=A0A0U5GM41_ASPCI|nr:hypothetical protein ASPCAL15012 [Aspergillus calidoustus]